jgi:hypothetical protein
MALARKALEEVAQLNAGKERIWYLQHHGFSLLVAPARTLFGDDDMFLFSHLPLCISFSKEHSGFPPLSSFGGGH